MKRKPYQRQLKEQTPHRTKQRVTEVVPQKQSTMPMPTPQWVASLKVGQWVLLGFTRVGSTWVEIPYYYPVQRVLKVSGNTIVVSGWGSAPNVTLSRQTGMSTPKSKDDLEYVLAPLTPEYAAKLMLLDTKSLFKGLQPQKMPFEQALYFNKLLQKLLSTNPELFAGMAASKETLALPLEALLTLFK